MYQLNEPVITLATAFEDYKKARHLKKVTIDNYTQRLNYNLKDWLNIPMTSITKQMCEERYASITEPATANSTFRTLKAIFNYAMIKYELPDGSGVIKSDPVKRLSELPIWHRDKRRKSIIPIGQVGLFFKTIWKLQNHTARDYLLTPLFTGLRSHEAACLKWDQVDLNNGTILIYEGIAKNGDELLIPMSDYLWKIINMRKLNASSEYVFPWSNWQKPFCESD